MGWRKGEISTTIIDRDWPCQVVLPAEIVRRQFKSITALAASLSRAPRNLSYRDNDQDFVVYCFAADADADRFCRTFGGERVTPQTRPQRLRQRRRPLSPRLHRP